MRKGFLLMVMLYLSINFVFGQNNDIVGPVVQTPVYFDVSPPLRDMVKNLPKHAETSWKDGIVKNMFNVRRKPPVNNSNMPSFGDPYVQIMNGQSIQDTTIVNFDGNTNTEGYYPPDTHGDVGPNHYFQVVNCHYSIYSKTGTLLLGPLANSSVFTGMPNNSNDGDAVVLYDDQADRWLFSQFSLPNYPAGPYYQMIAISATPDPTGSWNRYEYTFTNMPDYPKFGIWQDAYYMSTHYFTASTFNYAGCGAVAYNRTLMLAGSASTAMISFTKPSSDEAFGWLPSDCDGPFPAAGTPNYFLYMYDGAANDHLGIYEFHVDWVTTANSTFTNFLSLPVNAFTTNNAGAGQPGTTVKLDLLNDRMMYRLQYRSFGDHKAMVCNHTVDNPNATGFTGIRWYELRKTTGAWSIYQQSTYVPDNTNWRWMGSVAMDSSGNMALGYSISNAGTRYPGIRYCGRKKNDALNTMTIAERGIIVGGGSQTGTAARWGDYSALSCDPVAKATYWFTSEYLSTTSATGWKTRIAEFRWSNVPVVVTTAATAVTATGGTLNGTVNPSGFATTYHFDWGTTTSYGQVTTTASAGAGTGDVPVSAAISGLTTGVTYHYRINATNSDGNALGLDMTFIPGQAIVTTTAASAITQNTATAGGNVTTDGGSSVTAKGTCWATTANPIVTGSHTTDGTGTGSFTSSLTGLSANTTYHHRAYATNGGGTVYGSDLTFTTTCGVINTLPFTEGFEASASTPACWSEENANPAWQYIAGNGGSNPAAAHTGARNACLEDATAATNTNKLITPVMNLTGYTNVVLTFWHYMQVWTGDQDRLIIYYRTSLTGPWVQLQSYTANVATWTQRTINLTTTSAEFQVAFEGDARYGYGVCIDDIQITGTIGGPTLTVTPANQNVPATPAGATNFTVTSNSAWTAVSNQAWCTVTPSGTGNGTIVANYAINPNTTSRVANITVTVIGLTPVVVTVTQAGATPTLTVTPANQNVPATPAGSTNFTVTSNSSWTVVSDQTWCTVTPSGTGNGTIVANYTVNALTTSRVANITTTVAGIPAVVVTVTQAGATPTLTVTPANQNVPATPAGSTNFTVTSNSSWTVVSDQTWCTVTPSGTGNGTIVANYTVNALTTSRVANITTTVAGIPAVVVTVTQAGATPTLTVTPPNQNVPASPAGSVNFTVTSNSSWTSVSNQTWCTVTPSGTGNGTIVATYTENTTTTSRVATITVTVVGIPPVTVTVTQDGATPFLSVTPPNQNVPATNGTTTFSVASNTSWSTSSNQTWCTVTPPSSSGNGTINADYTDNPTTSTRIATITVTAPGVTPVTVTVTQAGTANSLTLSPSNQNVTPPAGTTNFTVTTTASTWTAVSDAPWCTVPSGGSGSGPLTATYDENTSTTIRIATITVSSSGLPSQSSTVTQAGAVPTLNVTPPTQAVSYVAGSTNFNVTSNSTWNVTSDQTWCVPTSSGSGNGTIVANYDANPTTAIRTANITVMVAGITPVVVNVVQDGLVGIADHTANSIQIIPNPANGLFRVVPGISGKIDEITILDLTGKVLISRQCKGESDYEFNLANSPQGTYLVKVKINDELIVRRLVISK
ncbi:MAG: BACON domain-containing carbohydrate-binding protein [Bacteroidetes bacterium]|nr:BACON domain-containing carbohydrate-binding protein [Bacteroidota bacterium]